MSQPKVLTVAIGTPLKSAGFKQNADTWRRETEDVILVCNLQKSNYGAQYFVNVAVWLKSLGSAAKPLEHHCHIRLRWDHLIPVDEKRLSALLDLEDRSLTDEERIAEISRLLTEYVLPFFSRVASLSTLRDFYNSGEWPTSLVQKNAQQLLR